MAKFPGAGSWAFAEELFERGDPVFVDEVRRVADADRLGAFAAKWHQDKRPASRQLLFDYLNRPMNAFRHEALVKRLFKLAEKAGDDEVMARFLVMFDRSIRRSKKKKHHYLNQTLNDRAAAGALIAKWDAEGVEHTSQSEWQGSIYVSGSWFEETVVVPRRTVMPRGKNPRHDEPGRYRLFSIHTRHYLRRRTWRYFRSLGKKNPERYISAVSQALKLYENQDTPDGLALIDNWCLIHVLFHHSKALVAKTNGWRPAEDRSLAELEPAPAFGSLWNEKPQALIDLLTEAHCRPVRQWTIRMIRKDRDRILAELPLEEIFALLAHEDSEVVSLAAEALRGAKGLDNLGFERWLSLLETPNPEALEIICELIERNLDPANVTLEQAVKFAKSRPLPLARLGFNWVKTKKPESEADCRTLLGLVDAEAEPVRPEIVRWAKGVLSASPHFQPDWVLEYLDCRREDVRNEGWAWFQDEARTKDHVELWQKLLESPYDDVRLRLVNDLERRFQGHDPSLAEFGKLSPELVRFLWASVLLNIHRGGRSKPVVVGQLVRRISNKTEETSTLLPLLSVALRSIRGPEFRSGLAAVIQLLEKNSQMQTVVEQTFPELKVL